MNVVRLRAFLNNELGINFLVLEEESNNFSCTFGSPINTIVVTGKSELEVLIQIWHHYQKINVDNVSKFTWFDKFFYWAEHEAFKKKYNRWNLFAKLVSKDCTYSCGNVRGCLFYEDC